MEKLTLISRTIKYQKKFPMYLLISNFNRLFFSTDKNCYRQVFLEKFKFVVKEKKIPKNIIDDV